MGEDESVGDILERFTRWYYDQLKGIYVFSESAEKALLEQGIDGSKLIRPTPDVETMVYAQAG